MGTLWTVEFNLLPKIWQTNQHFFQYSSNWNSETAPILCDHYGEICVVGVEGFGVRLWMSRRPIRQLQTQVRFTMSDVVFLWQTISMEWLLRRTCIIRGTYGQNSEEKAWKIPRVLRKRETNVQWSYICPMRLYHAEIACPGTEHVSMRCSKATYKVNITRSRSRTYTLCV